MLLFKLLVSIITCLIIGNIGVVAMGTGIGIPFFVVGLLIFKLLL